MMHSLVSRSQHLIRYASQRGRLRAAYSTGFLTKSHATVGNHPYQQSRALRTGRPLMNPSEAGRTVEKTSNPPSPDQLPKSPPSHHKNASDRYVINTISQGIVLDSDSRNKRDPQYASAQEGRAVRLGGSGSPLDAASAENGVVQMKPKDVGMGNKEGVGFVEQVGSASATARMFEREESARVTGLKVGRELARESFENARASAIARKLVG